MAQPVHRRRRRLILAAAAVAFAATMVLGVVYGVPYWRHWQLQRAIEAFKAAPTQANAEPLILALYHNDTREETYAITQALLDLKVIAKPSYAPNMPIYLSLASGNDVVLKASLWPGDPVSPKVRLMLRDCATNFSVGGISPPEGDRNSESVQIDPSLSAKLHVDGGTGFMNVLGSPEAPQPPAIVLSKPSYSYYLGIVRFEYRVQPYIDIEETRDVVLDPKSDPNFIEGLLIRLGAMRDPRNVPSVSDITWATNLRVDIKVAEPPASTPLKPIPNVR